MKEVNQIITDLKRKIFKPVYFLSGEEAYYIDLISDYIEKNVLDESEQEFNQTILYGKETTLDAVIGTAKRFPMMSEYQVVIVKEAQHLKEFMSRGGGAKGKDDDDENSESENEPAGKEVETGAKGALINYLEKPQPSTILVFCHKYKKPDKRQKLGKLLVKNSVYFESDKIPDYKMAEHIGSLMKEMDMKTDARVPQLLSEYLGTDLGKVVMELEKLSINIPKGTEITMQHIQDNIGISKDYNVFELQDALGRKDILKANKIIHYFNANPKEHFIGMTLGFLYGYFLKLMMVHFSADKSKFGIAKTLGLPPFVAEGYERASKNYNAAKIKAIFGFLREADLRSKGIDNFGTEHGELQRELIFKILH
ncbi:MAG: DNA polymerase III subunit delta [Bacteroidia bacterium]|nr:DNA polymerase III subunit delta [Bacteroidia bacterium]